MERGEARNSIITLIVSLSLLSARGASSQALLPGSWVASKVGAAVSRFLIFYQKGEASILFRSN